MNVAVGAIEINANDNLEYTHHITGNSQPVTGLRCHEIQPMNEMRRNDDAMKYCRLYHKIFAQTVTK